MQDTSELTTAGTVLSSIERVACTSPHNVAVRGSDGALTYAELMARAERLAHRLRELGVRPGDLVGQCLERSASLVVAGLGILKAGAAYVAIDPRYPDERVQWMLDDAGATAVVSDASSASRLGPGARRVTVVLGAAGELGGSNGDGSPPLASARGPGDLAYVVYTSGSTGRPKGVMVEHTSLTNLVEWHRGAFALGPADRCTQIASPGFDASVWEIWPSLASGAAVHVVPEILRRDPAGLRDWLVAQRITVTFLPTAVAESMLELTWRDTGELRYLLTGGDALTRRPPPDLGFIVVNNYGVSEAAVVATSGAVSSRDDGLPSIGRPIAGVQAEVVDEDLQPVEPGMDGELLIGGVAVGRGYLNRPDLTEERFLVQAGRRRYRTGDRVRLRADGEIEFLGRLDEQLSIRGFRVEPGEIVAALNSHPAVDASVVVATGRSSRDRQLVAYLVASNRECPDLDELAGFLGRFLPEHMVPSSYVWLEALPLTPHGKIDRQALPDLAAPPTRPPASRRPQDGIEAKVTSVVAELLELEQVGVDENFFLLGGHSMLGAQLIARLEDLFGAEVSLRYLFDHPTPAAIAEEVERQMADRTTVARGAA